MAQNAGFLDLNWKDAGKAVLMAFITAAVTALYTALQSGMIPSTWAQWKTILIVGVTSALAYLVKNFLTNSNDQFLKKDPTTPQ